MAEESANFSTSISLYLYVMFRKIWVSSRLYIIQTHVEVKCITTSSVKVSCITKASLGYDKLCVSTANKIYIYVLENVAMWRVKKNKKT